ncbi:MAG: Holliday junction branch migration protein RuvA [Chloroflexi bacterium]|jgi:holliday junction DNA helicase RuvA|nr:Holliday junction branch migration protein RuvA [Chloroflexota bacterium]MBT3671294.1 Holliday junction branch migration protein RuvA [Chloroflexota bacterium]MBT4001763.1 Holliday junction branch migration protein RuvA [Chloroflexota bacterium]MBT4304247.1 Holliday junction branch migration protein RuvA [Chloroflexota bacterium]MBT4534266.1 Holliday junction branch migration protein RuvA [Chloroflexota bacterium]
MISSLTGRIADIEEDNLIVEIGGIGIQVFAPVTLIGESVAGDMVSLFTHLVVRETELSLYGFATKEDREYFNMMIGVSGIGPRLGLATLSTLNPNAIRRAVFNEQADVLSQVPGIGKKMAQRIVLHLHDKIKNVDGLEPMGGMDDADTEVLAALTSLGYSIVESQAAIQFIPKDSPEIVEERIRIALSYFSN